MPTVRTHYGNIISDPFRNFKFIVQFEATPGNLNFNAPDGLPMGFMAASGFSASHEVIPYREGGDNTSVRKLPGQTNFGDITLTRGVVYGNNPLLDWFRLIFDASNGNYVDNNNDYRARNIRIKVLAHPDGRESQNAAEILVRNAWPSNLAFSDLDAGGNAVFVNQVVLAHEGWTYRTAQNLDQNAENLNLVNA